MLTTFTNHFRPLRYCIFSRLFHQMIETYAALMSCKKKVLPHVPIVSLYNIQKVALFCEPLFFNWNPSDASSVDISFHFQIASFNFFLTVHTSISFSAVAGKMFYENLHKYWRKCDLLIFVRLLCQYAFLILLPLASINATYTHFFGIWLHSLLSSWIHTEQSRPLKRYSNFPVSNINPSRLTTRGWYWCMSGTVYGFTLSHLAAFFQTLMLTY